MCINKHYLRMFFKPIAPVNISPSDDNLCSRLYCLYPAYSLCAHLCFLSIEYCIAVQCVARILRFNYRLIVILAKNNIVSIKLSLLLLWPRQGGGYRV